MSVETALQDKLTGTSAITALIGSGTACRLWPDFAPASPARPYVTYRVVSTTRSRHFTGITGSQVDFTRVQVDVWAATASSRRAVSDAIRDAMDAFSGAMGDESLDVLRVEVIGPSMSFDNPTADDELPIYRATLDLEISHH